MGYVHYESQIVYDIQYHIVWTTKYRYRILQRKIAVSLRGLIRRGCEPRNIQIIRGSIGKKVCASTGFLPAIWLRVNCCSISQRTLFKNAAGRVQGIKTKILGPASMGSWLFLQDGGSHDGSDDQRVHRESGQWPGWRNVYNCEGLSSVESLNLFEQGIF